MKPLLECPACHAPMREGKDDLSRWRSCPKYHSEECYFKAFERYINDSQDVSYISYAFKTWDAYTYYNNEGTHFDSYLTHVYSIAERKEKGSAMPILILPFKNFIPDFSNLEAMEFKIKLFLTFL